MGLENWKLCEGCVLFETPVFCQDGSLPLFQGKQCPCTTCLVKGICGEQCDEVLSQIKLKEDQYRRSMQNATV